MQLEMLTAVVEEGSVHKAAEKVFRTQPAVSIALRKLEQEIGAPLFDRSNRKSYVLTDTGEVLYNYARRVLNLRDESLVAIQELHDLQRGRLRVGANESACLYVLPSVVQEFRQRYPKIKIEIVRHLSSGLVRELKEHNLDCGILSFHPEDGDLEATPVMGDELVLVVSPHHELAAKGRVHIKELGTQSFIAHNVRSRSREKLVEAFQRLAIPLNISIEIATIETIKKFVIMNLGISFVPLMCVREELARGDLRLVPVDGFRHERTLWLVRRVTETPHHAAKAFMDIIGCWSEKSGYGGVASREPRVVGEVRVTK
ncbi:MAG TPA: LysR family transcriptional regulator [Blastocatellia bacterium]|nr:LysR family transcriptional regulator [Blastocatellia bacterium]